MSNIPVPQNPTSHQDSAQAIRLELQRLLQGVRGFTLLTTERRRQIIVSGHVDEDFLRSMALLIEAHPDVAAMTQLTAAEIRDHLDFYGSHLSVGEELMLNGRKTIDTLLSERASIGERALGALKIARSVNSLAVRESLVPHLEAIDRNFTRGRYRRATVKKEDGEAAPSKKRKKTEVKP